MPWQLWATATAAQDEGAATLGLRHSGRTPAGAEAVDAALADADADGELLSLACEDAFTGAGARVAAVAARLLGLPDAAVMLTVPTATDDAAARAGGWRAVAIARLRGSGERVAVAAVAAGSLGPRSLCALLAATAAADTAAAAAAPTTAAAASSKCSAGGRASTSGGGGSAPAPLSAAVAGAPFGAAAAAADGAARFARALVRREASLFARCHFDALFLRSAPWGWAEAAALEAVAMTAKGARKDEHGTLQP
jgi:hypothetical protein